LPEAECPKRKERYLTFLFCSLLSERFVLVYVAPRGWPADLDFCTSSVCNEVPFDPCQLLVKRSKYHKTKTANWQHHSTIKKKLYALPSKKLFKCYPLKSLHSHRFYLGYHISDTQNLRCLCSRGDIFRAASATKDHCSLDS
jgi:uncharacterized protein VirK/YbjX